MDALALLFLLGIPLGYLALQVRTLARWRGVFRALAALPLAGWLLWMVVFALDVSRDPTSHNLFPFEIVIGAFAASGYLGLLALTRRATGRAGERDGQEVSRSTGR